MSFEDKECIGEGSCQTEGNPEGSRDGESASVSDKQTPSKTAPSKSTTPMKKK